ncbi:hypothetical protein [Bradyrhizobium sp. NP1]|uniref:hypothetical protein n=1 Tax=Bradyrhizobium sp. NP1 TaxID=3049772 RepID=UPI0025A5DB5F|nr:hypothetical protein [Bradyrhizobium sp. NP1]WJR81391.1 hypothetical protein QOU61_17060 [Bradyrhizobium sp. NP1]
MINAVKDDPAQMRLAIYEFARARLNVDTSRTEESERNRLTSALETAIQGVEAFSARREEKERLPPPNPQTQIAPVARAAPPPATRGSATSLRPVTPAQEDILLPDRDYPRASELPFLETRERSLVSTLARFFVGMLLFGLLVGLAYYRQRLPVLRDHLNFPQLTASSLEQPAASPSPGAAQQAGETAGVKQVAAVSNAPPFPVPTDYGVYALNNDSLSELSALAERVPDSRIAVSTPVEKPSRTTLPDGKAKFIVFRRDLVGNTPDRIEVRVVARVFRALSFDARGKPVISPVSDVWNIRNISYGFRVRPVPGNPEMLLVQSEKPDFTLPAGRYVLVLKDQAYDFTVGGKVTDLAQCLERTDAANGAFYSECQKL